MGVRGGHACLRQSQRESQRGAREQGRECREGGREEGIAAISTTVMNVNETNCQHVS